MTEAEWLSCSEVRTMLEFVRSRTTVRKVQLFVCACARSLWPHLLDDQTRKRIETTECFVDALLDGHDLKPVSAGTVEIKCPMAGKYYAQEVPEAPPYVSAGSQVALSTILCMIEALKLYNEIFAECHGIIAEVLLNNQADVEYGTVLFRVVPTVPIHGQGDVANEQIRFARDVFGNPFQPLSLADGWLTSTVSGLARAAYEERELPAGTLDPDRLAILADALEDAGCTDADILTHLRTPTIHVRGCWVLDALLAKT